MSKAFDEALDHIQSDGQLQSRLLYGLSMITKENLEKFQVAWSDVESERRQRVIDELLAISEHSFEVDFDPIFIIGLNDTNPEVQATAIEGLWQHESPSLIPALIHLVKDGATVEVRAAAALGLGQFIYLGEIEELDSAAHMLVEQTLLQAIRKQGEDIEVVRRCIEAISFSSSQEVVQIIEDAYYHEEEEMQISAVFAMGRNGDKRWKDKIITELGNTEPKIRFEAARAAGELGLSEAVPTLIEMIEQDADGEVQQNAIWSLGQIGGNEAQRVLEALASSPDEAIRTVAEEALDELVLMSGEIDDIFSYTIGETDDDDDFHIVDFEQNGR